MTATAVPFGTVALPRGEARTFSSTLDVVIVRLHPRVATDQLSTALSEKLIKLVEHLRSWEDTTTTGNILRHRLNNLKSVQIRTKRWAPLEPIGSLAGSLFGLATTRDVREMKSAINQIIEELVDAEDITRDNIIALNDTIAFTKQIGRTVSSLTKRANQAQKWIDKLIHQQDELINRDLHARTSATAEALMSALEFHYTQARLFETQYLHLRDWAEAGHITESLVSKKMLTKTLQKIKSSLSPEFIYQHTTIRLIRVSDTRIAYTFTIPKTDDEALMAWQLVTAPYVTQSGTVTIMPELADVAMIQASGDLIDATYCLYQNPLLCWSPIRLQNAPCVRAILAKDGSLLHHCRIQKRPVTLPHLIRVNPSQIILTTDGEMVHERCPARPVSSQTIPAGTHLIQPDARCTVEGSNGWSFSRGKSANTTEVILEDYVFPLMNFSLPLPVDPTERPPLNWTALEKLTNFSGHFPRLHTLQKIRFLTPHDGYLVWVTFICVLLAVAAAALVLVERRWHPLKRCCPQQTRPKPIMRVTPKKKSKRSSATERTRPTASEETTFMFGATK